MWSLTTSSPSIYFLNSLKTLLRETTDAPKWASATALIPRIWESVEYLRPNLPLSRAWKSSLLLFITLHMSIYLKQRMARLSFAALTKSKSTWVALGPRRSRSRMFCNLGLGRRGFRTWDLFQQLCWADNRHYWRLLLKLSARLWPWRNCGPYSLFCSTASTATPAEAYRLLFSPRSRWAQLFSFLCQVLAPTNTVQPAAAPFCALSRFFFLEHTSRPATGTTESGFALSRALWRYNLLTPWLFWQGGAWRRYLVFPRTWLLSIEYPQVFLYRHIVGQGHLWLLL